MWNPLRFFRSEYYLNKGIKTYEQGKQKEGVDFLERSSKINPENELAYINLGIAAHESGDHDQAIEYFKKARSVCRYNPVPSARIAKIYIERNDIDKALEYIEDSLKCDITYSEGYYLRGMCYIEKKMYDKAAENFEKIIVDSQNLVWARILVASELIIKKMS